MLELTEAPVVELLGVEGGVALGEVVEKVCRRIPPLWDLTSYVAVNPFLAFTGEPIDGAAREVADGLGARVLPGTDHYRERWAAGDFGAADLARAAARSGLTADDLAAVLDGRAAAPSRRARPALTFAERFDRDHGTGWEEAVVRQVTRWCAVHALGGGTGWRLSAGGQGLFASWREAAAVDRTMEVLGLKGWRAWVGSLPETPEEATAEALRRLGVRERDREAYLYHLLAGVYGWASFFRRGAWEQGDAAPAAVAELLAVRACADSAVAALAGAARTSAPHGAADVEDESTRVVFQDALEDGYVRRLIGRFHAPQASPRVAPEVQAVFCIDVRSEPFRRHLEAQSWAVETRGFAGFFGVSVDWRPDGEAGSARCPVLLRPAVTLRAPGSAPAGPVKHVQASPAAFNFVELIGLAYGVGLAADTLAARPPHAHEEAAAPLHLDGDARGAGIPADTRVDLAAGILKNMGLTEPFGRLVLLCGHEAHTANNPHAAGLDCGACGGHGGALNARVAAALLNDPAVREALRLRGREVPETTHFLPGVHDTTTDRVTLLDTGAVPASHAGDLERLRTWLDRAGELTRAERAPALGLNGRPTGLLGRIFQRRSRDWSEVRPEWGLARNAAFIAARRGRTRGVNLEGRTFLHEYDASLDADSSVLTLILTAPVVVASWINLQYFASTVDNATFGCGTKTLHNRVGSLGVVIGNGGDLRTGLPLQSVQGPDGRWYHEPLRLQVVVEAPQSKIDAVLDAQPGVRALVENGWVRLFALDPDGPGASLRLESGGWEAVDLDTTSAAI